MRRNNFEFRNPGLKHQAPTESKENKNKPNYTNGYSSKPNYTHGNSSKPNSNNYYSSKPDCTDEKQYTRKNNQNSSERFFSLRGLENLLKKDINDLVNFFYGCSNLDETLKNTNFNLKLISVFFDCMTKIIQVNSQPATNIISNLLNTNFIVKTLSPLFISPQIDNLNDEYFISLVDNFITFTKKIIHKFPSSIVIIPFAQFQFNFDLYIASLDKTDIDIEYKNKLKWVELKDKVAELKTLYVNFQMKKIEKTKEIQTNPKESNIPIDYKLKDPEITVEDLHQLEEIKIESHRPQGKYDSFERYCNTMFYLEYEDCY